MNTVTALALPFRQRPLNYAELTEQLTRWARAFPQHCRLFSLGKTAEGRDLWVMAVGKEPDRVRPALWVDGNMHALELAGSCVSLGFIEDVLVLHSADDSAAGPEHPARGLSRALLTAAKEGLAYVMPRMSPDGAEAALTTGQYVRSVPGTDRPDAQAPRFQLQDVDGDGLALLMRREDPAGDFVESTTVPGMMVPRTVDDDGPYYKVMPEGVIVNFDASGGPHHVPAWHYLDDNRVDLNRNFPWSWAPEEEQAGAGAFPLSSPEARAVVEWTSKATHLHAWVNLHTFGGVYIRPLGHQPDHKMAAFDRALYRQLEEWVTADTGYATVSGYHEFTYEPEKPLRGDVIDYAYHQLGCFSVAVELWDLFRAAGLTQKKPFVDVYSHQGRKEMEAIAQYLAKEGASPLRPWRRHQHPQLGPVEVGGLDPREGIWNPPASRVDATCRSNSRVFLRILALMPRVELEVSATKQGEGRLIDVRVHNRGYLSTSGVATGALLRRNAGLVVQVRGARVVGEDRRNIGHLAGYGHGLYGGSTTWPYQSTAHPPSSRALTFVVAGESEVEVEVSSPRTGTVAQRC